MENDAARDVGRGTGRKIHLGLGNVVQFAIRSNPGGDMVPSFGTGDSCRGGGGRSFSGVKLFDPGGADELAVSENGLWADDDAGQWEENRRVVK